MKPKILTVIFTFICLIGFSQEKMNKLSVNPIHTFVSNILNLEYERGFYDGKFGISFLYANSGLNYADAFSNKIGVSEQSITGKYYINNISQPSFWYGAEIAAVSQYVSNDDGRSLVEALGISAKAGYQYIYKSLYADIYGGLGIAATDNLFGNSYYYGDHSKSLLIYDIGLKIGVAF